MFNDFQTQEYKSLFDDILFTVNEVDVIQALLLA